MAEPMAPRSWLLQCLVTFVAFSGGTHSWSALFECALGHASAASTDIYLHRIGNLNNSPKDALDTLYTQLTWHAILPLVLLVDMPTDFYTTVDAVRLYKISERTLRRRIAKGIPGATKNAEGFWLLPGTWLAQFGFRGNSGALSSANKSEPATHGMPSTTASPSIGTPSYPAEPEGERLLRKYKTDAVVAQRLKEREEADRIRERRAAARERESGTVRGTDKGPNRGDTLPGDMLDQAVGMPTQEVIGTPASPISPNFPTLLDAAKAELDELRRENGRNEQELTEATKAGRIDTVVLAFTDHYGRLMGKRLDAEFFLEDPSGTHACDYLLTVDMEMEPVDGFAFSNWDLGYGDLFLAPDMQTVRPVPWLDRTALIMCDLLTHDGDLIAVAPRSILRNQIRRLEDFGMRVMVASELEYFLYRTTYRDAALEDYNSLEPAGWYVEDYHLLQGARTEDLNGAFRRHLKNMGIPVESTKGEFGRGQHELNIRWCDALEMADRHVLLKQCVKEVADQQGAAATFMAKPHDTEAGSSSHLHLSLWSTNQETNLFVGDNEIAGLEVSETFTHFLGGWLSHLRDLMPCFAPTVNSYKRYQSQSWAPTGSAWSPDNRTTGFRIVGEGQSLRIECRIPGADVNPYLAYAAAIAAGLEGLESHTEPPPPLQGDAYQSEPASLPVSLREATQLFESSGFVRKVLGEAVVDHYSHFWRNESTAFDAAVTDWERRRYFERI